jgi:hypothetical protein
MSGNCDPDGNRIELAVHKISVSFGRAGHV